MNIALLLCWGVYIICGLIIQQAFPGIDALVPGFLIALQSGKKMVVFWLFILFCLIQEGAGAFSFGASILWYGGQIIFFYIGARFFTATNFISVLIFSAVFTVWHGVIFWLMSSLQEYYFSYPMLLNESIAQAIFIPVIWLLAKSLRVRVLPHAAH